MHHALLINILLFCREFSFQECLSDLNNYFLNTSLYLVVAMKNPGKVRNKAKRTELYAKYKQQKKIIKKKIREERVKETEALGEQAPPKQVNA